MLLWIIKCRAIAGLLRPNLLFLVNSIKMSVRTPYSFTVPGTLLIPGVPTKGGSSCNKPFMNKKTLELPICSADIYLSWPWGPDAYFTNPAQKWGGAPWIQYLAVQISCDTVTMQSPPPPRWSNMNFCMTPSWSGDIWTAPYQQRLYNMFMSIYLFNYSTQLLTLSRPVHRPNQFCTIVIFWLTLTTGLIYRVSISIQYQYSYLPIC